MLLAQFFLLTLLYGQVHDFLWTTKFQSEQANPKSLATKVCGSVSNTDQRKHERKCPGKKSLK